MNNELAELAIRILTGDVLGTTEQTQKAVTMAVKELSQPDVTDINIGDMISRQAEINEIKEIYEWHDNVTKERIIEHFERLPSAQPQYEELTPEETASEIASGSIMSAQYWLDAMVRLKQMGYVICKTTM